MYISLSIYIYIYIYIPSSMQTPMPTLVRCALQLDTRAPSGYSFI